MICQGFLGTPHDMPRILRVTCVLQTLQSGYLHIFYSQLWADGCHHPHQQAGLEPVPQNAEQHRSFYINHVGKTMESRDKNPQLIVLQRSIQVIQVIIYPIPKKYWLVHRNSQTSLELFPEINATRCSSESLPQLPRQPALPTIPKTPWQFPCFFKVFASFLL